MSVAFDNVASSSAAGVADGSGASALSYNLTVNDATNGCVIVGVAIGDPASSSRTASTVTVGGASASLIDSQDSNAAATGEFSLWKCLVSTTGTKAIVISVNDFGSACDIESGAMSFTGVDQTTPTGTPFKASGNSGTASVAVTDSATNDLIVYGLCQGSGGASTPLAGGATETERWDIALNSASAGGCGAGGHAPGASGSQTVGETFTSDSWAIVAVTLKQASGSETITMDKWSNKSAELIAKRPWGVVASGTIGIKN